MTEAGDRDRFSLKHGYIPADAKITVREDAPAGLRAMALFLAEQVGIPPRSIRDIAHHATGTAPDLNVWSGSHNQQARDILARAAWPAVYDFAEFVAAYLWEQDTEKFTQLQEDLNRYFRTNGIGWQMLNGKIETRGTEAFEATVRSAETTLVEAGLPAASREIREALLDLSRRPEPDLTGALHHGMGALEIVAREACGGPKLELGKIVQEYPALFPKPLDTAVEKAWGFASDSGRHPKEDRPLDRVDVELVVGLAATVATYLAAKLPGAK